MATYYMRADGTAANVAAATGPATDASKCMSVAVQNAGTFGADTVLMSSRGGDFTSLVNTRANGMTYRNVPGETPTIRQSTKVAAGSTWTDVGGGVYSIAIASITNPSGCWVDGTVILAKAASADLGAGKFFPDTTGNVLYVRLSDDSSPAAHDIYLGKDEAGMYVVGHSNITIDGIAFRHCGNSATRKGMFVFQAADCTIQNCDFGYAASESAIRIYRPTGTLTIRDNRFHYLWNGLPYGGGGAGIPLEYTAGGATPPTQINFLDNVVDSCYVGPTFLQFSECPVLIDGNVFWQNHVNCLELNGSEALKHTVTHNTIYHKPNATVIPDNGHGMICRTGSTIGVVFKSNLVVFEQGAVAGAEGVQIDSGAFDYIDIDYNAYWLVGPASYFFSYTSTTSDLEVWKTWLGTTAYLGKDAHSQWVDPRFVNAAIGDFRVRNPRLRNAGHDGATIGAAPYNNTVHAGHADGLGDGLWE